MSRASRRRGRRPRPRAARGPSVVGRRFEVEAGPVAHGGHCVARVSTGSTTEREASTTETEVGSSRTEVESSRTEVEPSRTEVEPSRTEVEPVETRVVFVRHTLPGERVVVEITEGTEGDRFWRGDAIEVLTPSPDRVSAPCPYAGAGRCGGCDFQHVALDAQRQLKAAVVREQLRRIAGLDLPVVVEAVPNPLVEPGGDHGLAWRTRQRYVELPGGRRGMRKHRSHEVIAVDECLLEAPRAPSYEVGGHRFEVADGGFWQVHPGAPQALVDAVLEALVPQPGERALDLYAGVGLFSRFLLDAVGPTGAVAAVEGDRAASTLSVRNCPGVAARAGDVAAVLRGGLPPEWDRADLVVLDPPRAGAKRAVVEQVVARSPRAVAYVACDPAALARDIAIFAERGYPLAGLRAFDLFPMTSHVEVVAHLVKSDSGLR